jgi:iron(III) transport system permease protein
VAIVLLAGFGWPLAFPLIELLRQPTAWRAWDDTDRLAELAENTAWLVGGTLALTMPAGVAGAVLLYRSDLPLRRFFRFLTVLTLFVPLPLFTSAWQAALGVGGWIPLASWNTPPVGDPDIARTGISWKPWAQGIGAAIWVHAVAGLPWVVWIVGQGLRWVERELEEDALLAASPWRVLWRVTLPRARAAIGAAALWIVLQTATEITVTDMMRVRTFAEEVYTQFVMPEPGQSDPLARAVAVSLPLTILTLVLVVSAVRWWDRTLPPLQSRSEPLCLFRLLRWRWVWLTLVLAVVLVLAGVPLVSLLWKAGRTGNPAVWSAAALGREVLIVGQEQRYRLMESLLAAAVTGFVAAALALVCVWLALAGRGFRIGLLILLALAWALPGPVIGLGLKGVINLLMDGEDQVQALLGMHGPGPLRVALYDGPSVLPILWASLLRFLPCAVALLWPVVRLLPNELRDAAQVDGASPTQELRYLVWPLSAAACLQAGLAVMMLSLGELSASKLIETPASETFAHWVFTQMHNGVTSRLAATCLLMLAMVAAGGATVVVASRVAYGAERENK